MSTYHVNMYLRHLKYFRALGATSFKKNPNTDTYFSFLQNDPRNYYVHDSYAIRNVYLCIDFEISQNSIPHYNNYCTYFPGIIYIYDKQNIKSKVVFYFLSKSTPFCNRLFNNITTQKDAANVDDAYLKM